MLLTVQESSLLADVIRGKSSQATMFRSIVAASAVLGGGRGRRCGRRRGRSSRVFVGELSQAADERRRAAGDRRLHLPQRRKDV